VFLAQTAAPTYSAAPVANSFIDVTRRRRRSLFPGGFFSARFTVSPLKHSLIYLPTAPCFSWVVCIGAHVRWAFRAFVGDRFRYAPHDSIPSVCRAAIGPMAESCPQISLKTP
jgi:hypothetical protein